LSWLSLSRWVLGRLLLCSCRDGTLGRGNCLVKGCVFIHAAITEEEVSSQLFLLVAGKVSLEYSFLIEAGDGNKPLDCILVSLGDLDYFCVFAVLAFILFPVLAVFFCFIAVVILVTVPLEVVFFGLRACWLTHD